MDSSLETIAFAVVVGTFVVTGVIVFAVFAALARVTDKSRPDKRADSPQTGGPYGEGHSAHSGSGSHGGSSDLWTPDVTVSPSVIDE